MDKFLPEDNGKWDLKSENRGDCSTIGTRSTDKLHSELNSKWDSKREKPRKPRKRRNISSSTASNIFPQGNSQLNAERKYRITASANKFLQLSLLVIFGPVVLYLIFRGMILLWAWIADPTMKFLDAHRIAMVFYSVIICTVGAVVHRKRQTSLYANMFQDDGGMFLLILCSLGMLLFVVLLFMLIPLLAGVQTKRIYTIGFLAGIVGALIQLVIALLLPGGKQ